MNEIQKKLRKGECAKCFTLDILQYLVNKPSVLIARWALSKMQVCLDKCLVCPERTVTHHIEGSKHVTVVVIGLQIFCDISKC